MPKKFYRVTFFRRKTKVLGCKVKSASLEDAILDAEFMMLLHKPSVMYDDIFAEEIH